MGQIGRQWVLILVLMEDTLRDEKKPSIEELMCLNPCFNGRYSQREGKRVDYAGINES